MKKAFLVVSAAVLVFTARGSTIVYDTFGPGHTYNSAQGFDVGDLGGLGGPYTYEEAAQFRAGASGHLTAVDLGLTYFTGFTPLPVNVYLYRDASGSPDNSHQTFLGSGTPTAVYGTTHDSIVSFAVAGTIPVTMGTTYWLVLKPAAANEFDIWNAALPLYSGMEDLSINDSTWSFGYPFLPAFRLTAGPASVPDSGSTFVLFLSSLAALLLVKRTLVRQLLMR